MHAPKKTQYNIKVDIHEVRDLSFRESANEKEIIPNPYIDVIVHNETKSTVKKNQAVNVVYNTSFNFSVDLTDYEFQRTSVAVCVLHKYTIQSALIGKCSFGLNYVYSKIQHWLYRIWVKLRNPDLPQDDVGFILISVGVYGPGDSIPIVNDSLKANINNFTDFNDEITTSNTNKGFDINITHYDLCVNIYRGQDFDLESSSSLFSSKLEPYVKVFHNGFEECTKVIKNDPNPVWNLCIHIPACTPCYDKNIIIEVVNGENNGIVIYSILLDFFEILKRELAPRWFNIYYNPQNQMFVRSNLYTQNANQATVPTTTATAGNFMGNNLLSAAAEKIFKSATQGININDLLSEGVTKVQNMFQDDIIREPYLFGGRIFLSVQINKTQYPGPICIKQAKIDPDPVNKEYIFCADIYEILSVRNNKALQHDNVNDLMNYNANYDTSGDTVVCVCSLGPHKLKTVPLLPNEVGSYVLNENAGRIDEFRIFLPQNNTEQIYDIFLYIYVRANTAVSDWISNNRTFYNNNSVAEEAQDMSTHGKNRFNNMLGSMHKGNNDVFKDMEFLNNYKLKSYVRIPYTYLLYNENKPKWFLMKNVETNIPDYNISFFANLIPIEFYKSRPKRLEYKLSRYYFRALIYEGLHFPARGYDAFPDPYIKVELAGQTIKTSTIMQTLNPNYYEAYEVEVILPTNLNLAPDISIEAFSVNQSFLYNEDILLGSCTYPIMKVPMEWKKSPVWIDLKSSQYKKCKAKLLVAFELVPASKVLDDTYPFFDDIRPSTLAGHVALFLIGIRMFKPLKGPSVTVCFGRDVDDTSQFLWHETTNKVISGKEGNWNFLKYFSLDVALPKRMQHHSFLEVRIEDRVLNNTFSSSSSPSGAVDANASSNSQLIGTAYITLNPLLPWLDTFEKNECVDLFKLHLLEEVLIEDAETARKSYNSALIYRNSSILSRKLSNEQFDKRSVASHDLSLNNNPYDADPQNEQNQDEEFERTGTISRATNRLKNKVENNHGNNNAEEMGNGNNAMEDEEEQERRRIKKKKNFQKFLKSHSYVPYNDPDFANAHIAETLEHVCINTKEPVKEEIRDIEEVETIDEDGQEEETKVKIRENFFKTKEDAKNKKKEKVHKTIYGFNEEILNFQIALADDDEQDEIQRDEMLYEYEVDMNVDDLPYLRATIFRCTDSGVPEAVGYLKYICNVYNEKTMHLKKEMIKRCDDLVNEYRLTRNLVVRAYIIQARGLDPPSGATDITTYVWIKNSNEILNIPGGLSHNIKDIGHTRKQGYKPEFNRCYQLLCSFPDEAIVQVCIVNQGNLSDEVIGYTYIDMEDRYFNKKIRQLMIEDAMPIELRSLKLENSTTSHGSLRCWFEIFTEEFAQLHPIKILTSNEPDDYQLRLVIWKVSNVAMDENSTISIFVRCIYADEDSEDVRDTDTHYNSKDGKGTFNWRFVYNIKIPTNATTLKVQIHNYAMLSSNEPIGEATLDLSAHFYRARKKKSLYHIPRFWLSCKHPAFKNKIRGNVEIEGSILTKLEAEVSPVGNGRDEPNKDPYLPPVTENRTYVDWVTINQKFGAATASIIQGLKWTGVWIVIAAIVVGILFLIFLLK